MQGDAIARWVRRHPEGARLLAALQMNDLALEHVVARARRERPAITDAEIRAHVRRLQKGG